MGKMARCASSKSVSRDIVGRATGDPFDEDPAEKILEALRAHEHGPTTKAMLGLS
jgi:hypothetical protein